MARHFLTPEQRAQIPVWREKWRGYIFATESVDRKRIRRAVARLYKYRALTPPPIIWLESLDDLPQSLRQTDLHRSPVFYESPLRTSAGWRNLWGAGYPSRWDFPHQRALRPALTTFMSPWMTRLMHPVVYGQLSFGTDMDQLAALDFYHEVLGLRMSAATPFLDLAKTVNAAFPLRNRCYVVRRWSHIALDAQDRPHSVTGPAIQYADGQSYYAYHGDINQEYGDIIDQVRRDHLPIEHFIFRPVSSNMTEFMIDAYKGGRDNGGGLPRICDDISMSSQKNRLVLVEKNEYGELYYLYFYGVTLTVLKVWNATPAPDGTIPHFWLRVPPRIHKVKQAVAWTFRMKPSQYAPASET